MFVNYYVLLKRTVNLLLETRVIKPTRQQNGFLKALATTWMTLKSPRNDLNDSQSLRNDLNDARGGTKRQCKQWQKSPWFVWMGQTWVKASVAVDEVATPCSSAPRLVKKIAANSCTEKRWHFLATQKTEQYLGVAAANFDAHMHTWVAKINVCRSLNLVLSVYAL